ncbi:hypothetical protein PIB30_057795 [Stylosanthes scabra]|uniref:Cucumisin n=1 Tax=Stylosanthes scabra TaxID=79078 RepID=A0ABU6VI90_9FABA|nr:hypothetical protein [Stylosanthes scabra]
MVKHNFLVCSVVIAIASMLSICDANNNDDGPKLHIVYLGSLPETTNSYSPTSHHLNMLQQVLNGSNPTKSLVRSYKRSFNGFAAMLTNEQAAKLIEMEGVVSVFPSKTLQTQTTRSWDFLGLPIKAAKKQQSTESNLVVGVIDTGIWPESESFSDEDINDPVPKKWKGTCAGGKNFTCNKKLIGARFYVDDSARDSHGHGSHTASIAAGNNVDNAGFYGIAQGTVRGAVPYARIAAYKVCGTGFFGCDDHDILAAFDDAIADGVDIISISIGFIRPLNLENDSIAIGSFHAMVKRVLVVSAAGNLGPKLGSVLNVAPWMLSVAANTIDRKIIDKVILGNRKVLTGSSINPFESNGTKIPIALSNGDSDKCPKEEADKCGCLDEILVKGKIVLCDNYPSFRDGVGGVIVKEGDTFLRIPFLPLLTLSEKDYEFVKSYKNSTKDPRAEILKSETTRDDDAPKVAAFSSRGPNPIIPEILKPDVSAPGVDILAAYSPISSPTGFPDESDKRSVNYDILSGTSMACPHVSGIATYVKSFHPDWSPAAIKSAILTSAKPMVSSSVDDVGEYAYGSGQANPIQAINPGLVYDINKGDYVQMLCNLGYDNGKIKLITEEINPCKGAADRSLVTNLNYPSFAVQVRPKVPFNISFSRTVTNVGLANSSYGVTITPVPEVNITVTPSVLSFKALDEKKSFVLNVIGKIPRTNVVTSSIVWLDGSHHVRSPIVIDVS